MEECLIAEKQDVFVFFVQICRYSKIELEFLVLR